MIIQSGMLQERIATNASQCLGHRAGHLSNLEILEVQGLSKSGATSNSAQGAQLSCGGRRRSNFCNASGADDKRISEFPIHASSTPGRLYRRS